MPFGNEVGLSQIANLYNGNLQHNHGELTAVYTCKQPSDGRWVQDFERGVNSGINPHPWQTDTSIGDWFYNRHWKYQPLSWTVHMLVDIVSKNGNLLLNVVLRPDGSLDPEVETMLHQLAGWTAVNGEAIYGTRPWLVYGEGPVQVKGGAFKEDFKYGARDIRFTTKGKTLYAIALGWPEDGKRAPIKSLAKTDDAKREPNRARRTARLQRQIEICADGGRLTVELPAQKISDLACSLKITGGNLKPVTPPAAVPAVRPGAKALTTQARWQCRQPVAAKSFGNVAVKDAAAVGADIHPAIDARVAGDAAEAVAPLVLIVVDAHPGDACVVGPEHTLLAVVRAADV